MNTEWDITEDQRLIGEALARYLSGLGDKARQPLLAWKGLAEDIGVLAAPFPLEHGGLGGGTAENMIVMKELGAALLGEPYLSTVVVGGGFLKRVEGPHATRLIPQIIAGEAIIAFAHTEPDNRYNVAFVSTAARRELGEYVLNGRKSVVYAAPWATHFLVTARTTESQSAKEGISLFLLDGSTPGIARRDYTTVDGVCASEITLNNVHIGADQLVGYENDALPLIEHVVDEAAVAVCAQALGVMQRLYEDTLTYARQRRQFGRAIAEFQVLQHRMVDMYLELQQAISITAVAARSLDEDSAERACAVSAAKWRVGKACRFIGQSAVQIHGAVGTTEELPIGARFKQTIALASRFGSPEHHLRRYARLMRAAEE